MEIYDPKDVAYQWAALKREIAAKGVSKRPLVEIRAALTRTIIDHNPDLPAGIAIVGGIAAAGFAGLLK